MSFTILVTLYYYLPHNPDDPKEENTVGKGENTGNRQFSFSLSVFYSIKERNHFINSKLSSANTLGLGQSKICHMGKG